MFEPAVEIFEIMEYVGHFQRPFVEGTAILKSKHLIECGVTLRSSEVIKVLGLCLQTSALQGKPHEINVAIHLQTSTQERKLVGTCSCKAGSGKCKHVVAVLLFLNRQPIDSLEDLSCTTLEQQWGKIKAISKAMYEPVRVREYCHAQKKTMPYNGRHQPQPMAEDLRAELLRIVLSGSENSALCIHMENRRRRNIVDDEQHEDTTSVENIRAAATDMVISSNSLMLESSNADEMCLMNCLPTEVAFYNKFVRITASEAVTICLETTAQVGDEWQRYRKVRITGSRCYELYTYGKGSNARDWEKKLSGMIFSDFKGNAHTTYGLENEPLALSAYERQTGKTVDKFGLIVNCGAPWLGFSPDGIVTHCDRIVEVKCLQVGKTLGGMEMARQAKCVNVLENGTVLLKRRHKYYGQIQLGMLLSGIRMCDFVLYSKALDECLVIETPFDEAFAQELISCLRNVYFKQMLPFITNRMAVE